MQCFQHRSTEAIGACRICGRGVCDACAKVQPLSLICSDACAARQVTMDSIVEFSSRNVDYQRGARAPLVSLFLGAIGLTMLSSGVLLPLIRGGSVDSYTNAMGAGFLVFAALIYRAQKKIVRPK